MRILVVDTATRRASIAAVESNRVIEERFLERPGAHAEVLIATIEDVLRAAGWRLSEVDLLAAGAGPGSFTGVRVGISTVKGIAIATAIPVVGVCSLEAMAHAARMAGANSTLIPMLDAKKGEVFVAAYDADGTCVRPPAHVAHDAVSAWVEAVEFPRVVAVGEIALGMDLSGVQCLSSATTDLPCPLSVGMLAEARWRQTGQDETAILEPLYVRPPDIRPPRNSPQAPQMS